MKNFLHKLKSFFVALGTLLPYLIQWLLMFAIWIGLAAISTLTGAIIGWFVGLFFGKAILGVLACIGIKGFSMWQIGATIGFVGGFFSRKVDINDLRKKR